MFGTSICRPLARTCTQETPFSGDDQFFWIGVERFCDKRLTHFWSVGVSGIYQIHPQLKGAVQDSNSFLLIRWRSPDSRACKAHGSKSETIYYHVSANGKLSTA